MSSTQEEQNKKQQQQTFKTKHKGFSRWTLNYFTHSSSKTYSVLSVSPVVFLVLTWKLRTFGPKFRVERVLDRHTGTRLMDWRDTRSKEDTLYPRYYGRNVPVGLLVLPPHPVTSYRLVKSWQPSLVNRVSDRILFGSS